ncbi:MAG: pyrroline-5-carboxylate reductase [Candidatus Omnitrophica bacterium]|nr:pyrroline-5-carboxylate reductase [Candidatus Omnitrophota bacterium]
MKKIGIIGFGNMGSSLAQRIKAKDTKVFVFDKEKTKIAKLDGIDFARDNIDLVKKSDTVILAVKPQDIESVLSEIKRKIKGKLIISIAAGIETGYIENYFQELGPMRVIRAMPNMPAKIGSGITCLSKGKFANDKDLDFAKYLFSNVGETLVMGEDRMDAATAISGSGPGYLYDLLEFQQVDLNNEYELEKFKEGFMLLLAGAAVNIGFSPTYAMAMAKATTNGSIALLIESKQSPSELKRQVTSKGGTTEAALEVLHRGESLENAVKAALERAKELSKR